MRCRLLPSSCRLTSDSADAQESLSAELERSKASVARLLKERDDLEDKLKQVGKELKQAINEKSVQVGNLLWAMCCGARCIISGLCVAWPQMIDQIFEADATPVVYHTKAAWTTSSCLLVLRPYSMLISAALLLVFIAATGHPTARPEPHACSPE
jgi:hypothetical protein